MTGMPQIEAFEAYRENVDFAPRPPDLSNLGNEDELLLIDAEAGRQEMTPSPSAIPSRHHTADWDDGAKYLWVIMPESLPIGIESNDAAPRTAPSRGRLCHTNLTGGAEAHAGGEMCFRSADRIVINGGSSRYRPRTAQELAAAAQGFARMGYTVGNMGWNKQINGPARRYKEDEVEWIKPNA